MYAPTAFVGDAHVVRARCLVPFANSYVPYLLLPLALCLHMAMVPTPFPKKEKAN
jgi:hypothetical protein